MIFTNKKIHQKTLQQVIGHPIKVDWKAPKAIGSSSFYLKSFESTKKESRYLKINSKCNFQKFSNGILLRSNFSNRTAVLPISESEIESIRLIRGKENITPFIMSPMWILLQLGVSKLTARYFRIYVSEYSIDEMKLKIVTKNYKMEFIQNGYIFERQLAFFKNLGYEDKLTIETNE